MGSGGEAARVAVTPAGHQAARQSLVRAPALDTRHPSVVQRARVHVAFPHHGEEDVLRGTAGSGTIFFSFCRR
jgi:hypothetical protein